MCNIVLFKSLYSSGNGQHSSGAIGRAVCHESHGCMFKSDSYLCLWELSPIADASWHLIDVNILASSLK